MASHVDLRGSGRPTVRQIARAAGVSISTVSRVLNGRPDVAPETREAVLRAARDESFGSGRGAQSAARAQTGFIGVTLPTVDVAYFAGILSGVSEALYEVDRRIVLCPTLHQHDREVSMIDGLVRGRTDGAILILPNESNEELRSLQQRAYPIVVVDPREPPDAGIPAVSAAHLSGAHAATAHLLELGHRRIAALTGPPTWMATTERLKGYNAAMVAAGVMPEPELVETTNYRVPSGEAAATKLLALSDRPTAIFAFSDNLAVGAMHAAHALGLEVPRDISIVGFDDSEQASNVRPPLTTVRQPLAEMGRMAVGILTRILQERRHDPVRVELETTLVIRGSTAPPAAAGRPRVDGRARDER